MHEPVPLNGRIVDADFDAALAARIYIRSFDGKWYFPRSDSSDGSAIEYRREKTKQSIEMHTTLSAHPFTALLPPGQYTITVERGKEYLPFERNITIGQQPVDLKIPLKRWIDMSGRGWYSGDTHVHRTIDELSNVMLAEDLNVAFPLSYWVTAGYTPPTSGDKNTGSNLQPKPIALDHTHVIYPINTEYEIFTVNEKSHTLGAVFILGHKTAFDIGVPPVSPIADRARREGAILDLDKHSWPWSLMLVPVMNVDLFELANNHVWRTEFGFRDWTLDTVPDYMQIERDDSGFTEWGWIDFGFQTYYALLNCGFRMRPTAGTASGVHPVPLGFGRVYVHVPGQFGYDKWMDGLNAGRSFVTTGPMLFTMVNGREPGEVIKSAENEVVYHVTGTSESAVPLSRIEILVNGRIVEKITPQNDKTSQNGYVSKFSSDTTVSGSGWIAVRVFEKHDDGRIRFAHSSPIHIDVAGKPLRPRRVEVDYLIKSVQAEIERNRDVLTEESVDEYRRAVRAYQDVARNAID